MFCVLLGTYDDTARVMHLSAGRRRRRAHGLVDQSGAGAGTCCRRCPAQLCRRRHRCRCLAAGRARSTRLPYLPRTGHRRQPHAHSTRSWMPRWRQQRLRQRRRRRRTAAAARTAAACARATRARPGSCCCWTRRGCTPRRQCPGTRCCPRTGTRPRGTSARRKLGAGGPGGLLAARHTHTPTRASCLLSRPQPHPTPRLLLPQGGVQSWWPSCRQAAGRGGAACCSGAGAAGAGPQLAAAATCAGAGLLRVAWLAWGCSRATWDAPAGAM